MKKLILFGDGQMAVMMAFYFTHDSPHEVAAFTVNRDHIKDSSLMNLPVVPFEDLQHTHPPDQFAMSIPLSYRNLNQLRADKYREAKDKGYTLVNYVSSKAMTWPDLVLGDNCILLEGSVVQPFSGIGSNVFVGCGSIVGHHCFIGDHCFLAPGSVALGYVRVDPYCLLGANCTIRDGVTVAEECIIGTGVTISRNTKAKEVYIAERTEPSKKRSDELRQWLTWSR
jgi:sugar O-acyltransferase (sialic acid O-acetyltransferase NeuD family)